MPYMTAATLNIVGKNCKNRWQFSLKLNRHKLNTFMRLHDSEYARRQEAPSAASTQTSHPLACDKVILRPFFQNDYVQARALLHELPALYPGGDAWLKCRLGDALAGAARCTVAASPHGLVGITIETPKGSGRLKLSTLYIHPDFRRSGLGTRMLEACRQTWILAGIQQVHVTVDARRSAALAPLLVHAGFRYTATEKHRYGPGRHETIFHWCPDPHADTNDPHVDQFPFHRGNLWWGQTPRVPPCADDPLQGRSGSNL